MNDIEKINEELRNYKLYKIQRALTREQEFTTLKNDLTKIRKNEIINYFIVVINVFSIVFFIYQVCTAGNSYTSIGDHKNLMIANFILVVLLSLYLTIIFFQYNRKLKLHIKTAEDTVEYFRIEGENLKSIYESYVDNYLERNKKQ